MNDQLEVQTPTRRPEPRVAPPRRRSRWTLLLGILIVAATGFAAWRLLDSRQPPHAGGRAGGPPQPVGVATVGTGNLDVVLTGLGAVTPLATVTVVTQINGQLTRVNFNEGQEVHKGDFLAQIDPRPYQVALEQAQGTLAHDQGLLGQARADYARYVTLNKQDSISKQQVDDQAYLIKQYEGTVISDQGAVDSAKLNLVYCHITSPVDGRVGIRLVDPGNYVQTSNTSGLFVLTQEQPMSVLFTLPEDNVDEIGQQMKAGPLTAQAYDRTNTKLIATGTLASTDNEIDSSTGTLKLRALFQNQDEALFPQQFVNVRLIIRKLTGVVVVPAAAVQHGAPGDFVYLVKPDNTVAVQVVKTGVSEGQTLQVVDGLTPGQTVVTDGLDRLRDGARVSVIDPNKPEAEGAPSARRAGRGNRARPAAAPQDGAAPAQ